MYELPPLKYPHNALEPYIDEETMRLHHDKHAQKYMDNLNALLKRNNYDYRYSMEELVNHLDIFDINDRGDILFNLGGVLNHILYFDNMSPNKNNVPANEIATAINGKYQNFNNFKNTFKEYANNLVGSGYTMLVVDDNGNLNIINVTNQETPYSFGYTPIMALDLWEHAYYLKYKNERNKYIDNFFEIVDFNTINNNYKNTKKA